jgi:hypothetical protein
MRATQRFALSCVWLSVGEGEGDVAPLHFRFVLLRAGSRASPPSFRFIFNLDFARERFCFGSLA